MAPSSTRPTNKFGRHILPNHRPRAVDTAQRPSSSFEVSSYRTTLEIRASQPHAAGAAPGPSSTGAISQNRAMAAPAPESAPMERQVSRPYINNNTAPPYSNREAAMKHQSATITYIEQRNNWYMGSGPSPNATDAADEPSSQVPGPEDSTRPGQAKAGTSSPLEPSRKLTAALALVQLSQVGTAALTLVQFSQDAWAQYRAQQAMARLEPDHGSPATRSPGDSALAPGDSQQGPRESKRTGEDDRHTDGSTSSVLASSGSRSPLPSSKPQAERKRKRVEDEEEQEKETEKESKTKKTAKAKGRKANKDDYKFKCHCGKGFSRNEHLQRHEKNVHGIETEGGVRVKEMFQCPYCDTRLSRKDNLDAHRKAKHPGGGPAPMPKSVFIDMDTKSIVYAPVPSPRLSQQTAKPEPAEPISGSSSSRKQDREAEKIQKANNK